MNNEIVMTSIPAISPSDARDRCQNGAYILDIRPESIALFKGFAVDNVIWCDRKRIKGFIADIPINKSLIVADSTGIYSREVSDVLVNYGFKDVAQMAGGFIEWERDGLPVIVNNRARLSGSCVCQLKYRNLKG